MRVNKLLQGLLAVICTFFLISTAQATRINKIYVFGDSLSDNGNHYSWSDGQQPKAPYFLGRFSNGPVWVEYLAYDLLLTGSYLQDYAVGGAKTSNSTSDNGAVPSLLDQVSYFTTHTKNLSDKSLFIVWDGADNFFSDPMQGDESKGNAAASKAVADITNAIQQLYAAGARQFLVANLPDLGLTPNAGVKRPGNKHYKNDESYLSIAFNRQLLKEYQNNFGLKTSDDLKIMFLNTDALFKAAIGDPQHFGLTNVTQPCYIGNFSGKSIKQCTNPDQYLFWDMAHPTTTVHQLLANIAFDELKRNGFAPQSPFADQVESLE